MPDYSWLIWLRKNCYFIGLALMSVAMPLSKALLSISLVVLAFAWFIAPDFKMRFQTLKVRKSIWVFALGYLIVVAGLFYSTNIGRTLFLLGGIKISLILLPIIIGTFTPLTHKQLKILLILFTLATLIATLVSTSILFHLVHYEFADTRNISIFIESVRFALLVALDILLLGYVFYISESNILRAYLAAIMLWLLYFLTLLQALTGILVVLGTLLIIFFIRFYRFQIFWRILILGIFFLGLMSSIIYINSVKKDFYTIHKVDSKKLDTVTANGNLYKHNFSDTTRVNGHLVWIYVCEDELRSEWAKRSNWPFDSLDLNGWVPVKKTLVFYLSSMGLRKDSAGMSQLTERDIRNIEYGHKNKAMASIGLYGRTYDVIREFDTWQRTGKPAGSITIRINALVNGWKVFKQNPIFGTGYGDIDDDIQAQYCTDNAVFGHDMRQNPHNQFLTILIGAGIIGFILFMLSMILPCVLEKKWNSIPFIIAFCLVILSFLSDDTLERMVGAIITAFTFSLFLYAIPDANEQVNNTKRHK